MAHRRDAERIVKNLDGEKMAGEKVDIQHAKGKNLLVDPHFNVFFSAGQSGSSKANNYRRVRFRANGRLFIKLHNF